MKSNEKNKKIAATIRRLSREEELERIRNFGRLRSKTWGGKPSPQKERHVAKQKLNGMVHDKDFNKE